MKEKHFKFEKNSLRKHSAKSLEVLKLRLENHLTRGEIPVR
jgi:hypothetical protein